MSTSVQLIRSAALSGVEEYACAAIAPRDARLVFLAGACPLNPDGSTAAIGDYAGQAAACISTMTAALHAAGATLEDVVSTRVLVASTRQSDLVEAWNVVRDAFGDHDAPSTLLGVTVLGYNNQLVEIEAIAALSWHITAEGRGEFLRILEIPGSRIDSREETPNSGCVLIMTE